MNALFATMLITLFTASAPNAIDDSNLNRSGPQAPLVKVHTAKSELWRDEHNELWIKTDVSEAEKNYWLNLSAIKGPQNTIHTIKIFEANRSTNRIFPKYKAFAIQLDCRGLVWRGLDPVWLLGQTAIMPTATSWQRVTVGSREEAWAAVVCS